MRRAVCRDCLAVFDAAPKGPLPNRCRRCGLAHGARKMAERRAQETPRRLGTPGECLDCGEIIPPVEAPGHRPQRCAECGKERRRRQDAAKYRKKHLRRHYGITPAGFDAMLAQQDGVCAITGCDSAATDVDHDHATGVVRKLLCGSCNRALGLAKESPDILIGMAEYLKVHNRT